MNNSQYTPEVPISSIATALAPAALGIVRVSGKDCIELVSRLFSSPKRLLSAPGNTIVYGWIKDGENTIDEVMCAVYRAPKSFTGEDMVEIFCHGGPSVVTAVHSLMLKNGFKQAERGEYTFRAYINGKTDLTKAEAVKEIIESHTDASRGRACGRLAGSLYEEIDSIKKLIIDTLAAIEVEIEYPEDEETIADSFDSSDIKKARDRLQSLADSWKGEKLYQDGARVVLCGRTNAGKSSLFNAILKEERAIVSDIEGTTRDFLESWASFDGIPVRLFDTAGLRKTEDVIEAQGVEITKNLSTDADVILYLIDSTCGITEDDKAFLSKCTESVVLVWNKSDSEQSCTDNDFSNFPYVKSQVHISAKQGTGLSDLYREVKAVLTSGLSTERTQAGLGSERQKNAVEEALECVEHALVSAEDNYTLDAVVQDLEDCLESLGIVTGEVTPDDVLGSIFANFCVGK
ncbi:MAG: tRNA uridine-5-carboxymethylaminomethyl(34) synthesis GTPase MnmE [Treponema sp.]|nr:tRNA uridine-5-carboxymethylaminomethyl(34) synthesis GTPase MnmE [Treponema sp.]